ncbi:MAG TPA: glycosyl hydrolase family 18 protein [Blastocatellia bacterium]
MPRQNARPLIALCASLFAAAVIALATTNQSAAQGPCRGNWAEGNTYNAGDSVTYNGATYTALQTHTAHVGAGWTPASTPSLWRTGGSCAGGPTPTPTPPPPTPTPNPTPSPTPNPGGGCNGIPTWTATAIFTGGQRASLNGFIYEAKWWNQNQNPETNSGGDGPWRIIGPCGPTPTPTPTPAPTPTPTPLPIGSHKTIAYFTQWGIYGRNFKVKHLDVTGMASKLTHIHYAFGNINEQGRCFVANQLGQGDAWADYQHRVTAADSVDGVADAFNQPLAGNFNQLRKLKQKYPHIKVLFSLGGWTWSKFFSNAALPANRSASVASCMELFIKGNLPAIGGEPQGGPGSAFGVFDGIDLDWEWPGSEGNAGNVIRPEDKANFTAYLAEWRAQLDAYGAQVGRSYLLSAFLPADPNKIDAGFEANRIFDHLDYATMQGYDFHGAWENRTNHQSQLHSPADDPHPIKFSIHNAVTAWVSRGAPAAKLVIGVPAYGRGWSGVPSDRNGLYQLSAGPAPGTFEAGIEDYDVLKNRPGLRFRDATHGAFWLYDGSVFWSYDDPTLVEFKGAYVKSNGLGGLMLWSADGDDGSLVNAMFNSLR